MSRILTFVSGRGGAGRSVLTAAYGLQAAARGLSVLIIDLHIGMRCQDQLLGLSDQVVYDILDICDARVKSRHVILHAGEGRPDLIPASQMRTPAELNTERLSRLLGQQREVYDRILLDVPAGWNEVSSFAAEVSDAVILLESPDRLGFRAMDRMRTLLTEHRADLPILPVLNGYRAGGVSEGWQMGLAEIRDLTGLTITGWLPEDEAFRQYFLSEGRRGSLQGEAGRALERIAARAMGESVPMQDPADLTRSSTGFLSRWRKHS